MNVKYNTLFNTYRENQGVQLDDKCNGYTVINTGTCNVVVNGILLHSGTATNNGESFSIGGNLGEILNGRIDISFIPPFGANRQLTIIQKIYL